MSQIKLSWLLLCLSLVSCPRVQNSPKENPANLSAVDEEPRGEIGRKILPPVPVSPGITSGFFPLAHLPPNPSDHILGVVVVDPGHGTRDANGRITGQGATGHFAGKTIPEHSLTLDYAMWLLAELRSRGIVAFSTRTYDEPWFQVNYAGHNQEANNRLRAEFAASHQADLFVRIHFDGSANPQASGFSVWYNDQSQFDTDGRIARESLKAAQLISQKLSLVMELPNLGVKSFDRPIYGFVYAKQPSILLELAFLSTPSDCAYVLREESLKSITQAVADGIEEYFQISRR